MDTIGNYLTIVRNALKANHRIVEVPASGMKKEITRILKDQGYILDYKIEENPVQDKIKIALKYHPTTKQPAIRKIQRISRPGLRKYSPVETMPRVLSGLGIAIISTSKGLMTDKEAKRMNMGGEVICYVY
ncbi:MAG TPA: 30S ribosomal protein S8 [Bacteroidia bacterium]|mgnify:FL=1|jgi:small subunit ribosomal protein S8|nr:30S ribosomal protein S8 [Bacteroidia bacterium]HNO70933.1 30S ribosomal protein S8 [Bacteroidia bacterium]